MIGRTNRGLSRANPAHTVTGFNVISCLSKGLQKLIRW
jgi:hypothetical protein